MGRARMALNKNRSPRKVLMSLVPHARNTPDNYWIFTFATPAQATTSLWAAIDTEAALPGINENTEWEITYPATPTLANGQTIIVTAYTTLNAADSITGLDPIATLTITGAGGTGGPALFRRFRLPSQALRYLRLQTAVSATAGNNTAIIATAQLFF